MRKDWEYKKLGEMCDIYQPKTISTDSLYEKGKYPVYGANGIIGRYNEYNHEATEILLTCRGATCGRINISVPYSWINGNAMVIHRKSDALHFDFLKYSMMNIDYSLIITGAAQPQITRQKLAPTIIPIPPKPTQLAIVAELDKINELIQLKKQQLKDYDQLAQSIFYEMFGDPVENEKGWKVKKLGEMCSAITKGTTPTSIGFNFEKEGVNFVKVEAFGSNDRVDKEKLSFISEECHQNMLRSQLKENDILICIAGATVGKLSIVDFSILPANTNQACAIVRVKDKQVIFYSYLYGYLKYSYIQLVVNNLKKGVAQPNLSLGQIRDFNIKVPPLPLQQQFAARIEAIERQKQQVSETIKDLETLLASRMQYWFD